MTDPQLTLTFITTLQAVENAQAALTDLNTAMQLHGPSSDVTAYYQLLYDRAHKELVTTVTEVSDYVASQIPQYPKDETPDFLLSPYAPILLTLVAVVSSLAYASLIAWLFHTF